MAHVRGKATGSGGSIINGGSIIARESNPHGKKNFTTGQTNLPLPNILLASSSSLFSLLFPIRHQPQFPALSTSSAYFAIGFAENSLSFATGAEDGSEPMQVDDENEAEAEENSKTSIGKVEERMRECFIVNKKAKRQLSLSSAAAEEDRRISEGSFVGGVKGFDPTVYKLWALDLVYQFHG